MKDNSTVRDVAVLVVPRVGRVGETGGLALPFRLTDGSGAEVAAVSEFLGGMLADDASPVLLRSYAYELLAWFRFLWKDRQLVGGRVPRGGQDRLVTSGSGSMPPVCACSWAAVIVVIGFGRPLSPSTHLFQQGKRPTRG